MARKNKIIGFKINKASIKKRVANSAAFKKAADWHAKRRFNKEKRKLSMKCKMKLQKKK